MVWWEAVLSPALQVLFDKLASGTEDVIDFLRSCNISDFLLEELKVAYFTNAALLDDAETKQYQNTAIETWLDLLKEAIFAAEDLLDELATEALRQQQLGNQQVTWSLDIPSYFARSNCRDALDSRIAMIINRLNCIAKQKNALGLKEDGGGGVRYRIPWRSLTTPSIMESHVFGRDHDREEIIKLLLFADNNSSGGELSVVSVLGMGGLGKTVVAQLVFNDRRVDEFFDVKAWACVSEDFNLVNVTKSILESVTNKPWETMSLELLQSSLRKKLNKKKFLIVLDDVWTENHDEWCELTLPFLVGAPESRIIVTTRNESVSSVTTGTCRPYHLSEVSDDSCWLLLSHHAFQGKETCPFPELEAVGREIANKCKGWPLAAKTVGRTLRSKQEIEHWHVILRSNPCDFSSRRSNNILPALLLSYNHLPANLRRCFAYCSIFPKGYHFEVEKLVLLWMAEGFVQQGDEENTTMEELGKEYFIELLSRSFFQRSTSNSNKEERYVMHDAINGLACYVSRKTCLSLEHHNKPDDKLQSGKVRHFSYVRGKYDVYKKFEALSEGSEWLVRTFLPLPPEEAGFCYLSSKVVKDLLPRLRCLRVLSLSGYCIEELPESIGHFKHLRYLDLSSTAIKSLPRSICTLFNLQTLMLNNCDALNELPQNLTDLINLRYFDVSGSGVQDMPLGMGKLRDLQVLPEFVVGSGIGEMRNLLHLQGKVTLSRLENVVNAWDARKANLTTKKGLKELVLEWTSNFSELQDHNIQTSVFEMLQPHHFVQIISIRYFNGVKLPTWLGDPSFLKMVMLSLSHCKKISSLPPLGQLPLLRELHVEGLTSVKSVGVEFYGEKLHFSKPPFPSLTVLCFKEMHEWENWTCSRDGEEEMEAFPILHTLRMVQCPNLKGRLPNRLPSLETLIMHETQEWIAPLPRRLPSLHSLDIKECSSPLRSSYDFSLISSLQMSGISNFTHLHSEMMEGLKQLKNLQIMDCYELEHLSQDDEFGLLHMSSLQSLIVRNCPLMTSLCSCLPSQLEYMELENCRNLSELPRTLHSALSLRELTIKDCPSLASFPDTCFPRGLRGLMIRGCGLVSLPKETMEAVSSLEYMYISRCYDLVSFPDTEEFHFPVSLQQLTIDQCVNLCSLPDGMMRGSNVSLKVLEIFDCSSLVSFPCGVLPDTLKTLTIFNCASLESLSDILNQDCSRGNNDTMLLKSFRVGKCPSLRYLPNGLSRLSCLDYFEIEGCPGVVSFPEGGLPSSSLKKVHIINCENLSALPGGIQNLTSLEDLSISDCPGILTLPVRGLPLSLVSLELKGCDNISDVSDWGLHRLNSLNKLSLSGGNSSLSIFPEWLLPCTITSLQLGKLPKLDFETNWLQNLTALEDLKLKDCPHLRSLPLDKLPPTLSCLEISGCPLVEQQCVTEWERIDHIPWVV